MFKEYLLDNGVTQESLVELSRNCVKNSRSVYEELLFNGSEYDIDFNALCKFYTDYSPDTKVLTETNNVTGCDLNICKSIGVSACETIGLIPLVLSEEKETKTIIVTIRPDDRSVQLNISKFSNQCKDVYICSKEIWSALLAIFLHPLKIEESASILMSNMGVEATDISESIDSEAKKLYMNIIQLGYERRASDIHILPTSKDTEIHYRIDGYNYHLMTIPKGVSDRICNLLITSCGTGRTANAPFDGKMMFTPMKPRAYSKDVEKKELRVSILPAINGDDANIRFLSDQSFNLDSLGMTKKHEDTFKRLLDRPYGLIIQTGGTGSGKSTTMYAGLEYIKSTSNRTILTVEDPVERVLDGATQVSVNNHSNLGFAVVARQFLRHDLEVGVIGEIRDQETAVEGVRCATTGHLILSSVHTNDALGSIERMYRLGIDPYTLGEVLIAVMGQRLVRRLCPNCKQPMYIPENSKIATQYNLKPNVLNKQDGNKYIKVFKAVGCSHCGNIGYKGRVSLNEILEINEELRELIQTRATRRHFVDALKKTGFESLYSDALTKVYEGTTSLEEIHPLSIDTLAFK